jgi:hypothetical protein
VARASRAVTVANPAGDSPRMRANWAVAPRSRAAAMVGASVNPRPVATAGTTTAELKTAKAAATSSPGTCPRAEPRLQK